MNAQESKNLTEQQIIKDKKVELDGVKKQINNTTERGRFEISIRIRFMETENWLRDNNYKLRIEEDIFIISWK